VVTKTLTTKLLVKEKYVTTKKGGDQKCWQIKMLANFNNGKSMGTKESGN
jgi:hypothetical protein